MTDFAVLEEADLPGLLPEMSPDFHKGERGSAVIFASSAGGMGAGILSARAASASGAGLVSLIVRDELWPVAAARLVSQIVRRESDGPGRKADALLFGPGWGNGPDRKALLIEYWHSDTPIVLDADALAILPLIGRRKAPLIITPHPGEFTRLARACFALEESVVAARLREGRAEIVSEMACHYNAIVVLKDSVTMVMAPNGQGAIWEGRCPWLATGGSGDVLAGLLTGLLARGSGALDAARAAVIIHGMAGRECGSTMGFFEAESLVPYLARISGRIMR